MITYNQLRWATGYAVAGVDDFLFVKNFDPDDFLFVKNFDPGDGVEIEKDESLGLDDCNIDLGED